MNSREDGKQQGRLGLKKTARKPSHGPPLASCLAVAGVHLMCRQHSGPRNLYGLDICRNMPCTVVRDAFVLSTWETAWKSPGLGGSHRSGKLSLELSVWANINLKRIVCYCFTLFWPWLNKENMLQIYEVSTFSFAGLKRLMIWIIVKVWDFIFL